MHLKKIYNQPSTNNLIFLQRKKTSNGLVPTLVKKEINKLVGEQLMASLKTMEIKKTNRIAIIKSQ